MRVPLSVCCVLWCSTLLQVDAKREKDAKQGNKFAQVLEGKVNRKVGQMGGLRWEGKAMNASTGHVNAAIDWRQTRACVCVCTGCQADSNDSCLWCNSLWREAADSGMPCFPHHEIDL